MTQTADGYIWVGGEGGLVRFDGARFVHWSPKESARMVESVLSLLGTRDGSLWVGASNGFGRRNGDSFDFRQIGRVNALVEDAGGAVWIALSRMGNNADGPLCRAGHSTLQCFGAAQGIGFRNQGAEALTGDRAGGLWIGTTQGVAHWTGSSATEYFPKAMARAQGSAGVLALELEQDGSLLVGAGAKGRGAGLQRFLAGTWSDYRAGDTVWLWNILRTCNAWPSSM
jgi:ligand-binding sensor domain-containing protein